MKKTIIGIVIVVALCASLLAANQISASEVNYYTQADFLKVVNANDVSAWDIIENRNGNLVIEKVIGIVTDADTGAGHQLENEDYYICYKSVDGVRKGNIICTYFVYNPESNYADDIILRFDYIIDSMAVESK